MSEIDDIADSFARVEPGDLVRCPGPIPGTVSTGLVLSVNRLLINALWDDGAVERVGRDGIQVISRRRKTKRIFE